MKILVVDNMLTPFDPYSVPGGTERRNVSDAVSFAKEGHEVFMTVAMPSLEFEKYKTHEGVNLWCLHTDGKEVYTGSPTAWRKRVLKRIDVYLERNGKPDVVHYGSNSFYWLAKHLMVKHQIPLSTQIGNYLSGNAMYDTGRLKDLFFLRSLGAFFVANTDTCQVKFQGQIDGMKEKGLLKDFKFDTDTPLFNHVNKNNAGVGFVGNPEDGPIREDGGYAVLAARADPAKRIGSFASVKFPLVVFLKYRASTDKSGFFEKLKAKLEANPNITVRVDQPYSKIMRTMSKSRLVIVSWPDETFGLTAFEAASFGVPSAVFRRKLGEPNATHEFLSEIMSPPEFQYNDPLWRQQLQGFMNLPQSTKMRERLADKCRTRYSYADYVNERLRSLRRAVKLYNKVNP